MKRSLKLLIIFILVCSLTGCMKLNYSMSINKDKSMDLEIIMVVDKSMGESGDMDFTDLDIDELAKKGFLVGAYNEGSLKGSKIFKSYKNIDDISTSNNNQLVVDLGEFLNGEDATNELFIVKKGFLKNTYIGRFKISGTDNLEEQLGGSDSMMDDDSTSDEPLFSEDEVFEDGSVEGFEDMFSSMTSMLDIKFIINVPYKALSNNATSVDNDGKTLTWNLLQLQQENTENIEFEFQLYNWVNIIICLVLVILIIIIIIVIINKSRPKKKQNNFINNTSPIVTPVVNNQPMDSQSVVDSQPITTNQEFVDQINPNNPSLTFINRVEEDNSSNSIDDKIDINFGANIPPMQPTQNQDNNYNNNNQNF